MRTMAMAMAMCERQEWRRRYMNEDDGDINA